MCQICSTFNPQLSTCEYATLTTAVSDGPLGAPGDTLTETGDASGNASTTAGLSVGEFFLGELSSNGDVDWIEITLEAGTYTIAGVGTGPLDQAVNDISLRLRDAAGNELQYDDDDGPGLNADITVTVTSTTTFYVDVQSWNNTDSGTYGVSVTEGTVASFNMEMGAGNIMRPNQAWTTTPGVGETDITWAVRASGNDPSNNTPLQGLDASQVALTEAALEYLEGISGLNFTQVNPGGASNNATMLFGAYSAADGAGAYAYYPGSGGGDTAASANAGDVWLNNNSYGSGSYAFGSFNAFAMLHEIGHAIGLAHPGDYNAGPNTNITYANSAQFIEDSHQYTIMSYFDETNTGVSAGLGYPDTFMLYDFMAIHELYGADATYNAGNTVYGFNASDAASVYDFTVNTTPFMTVYDGQGTDTIDLSGYTMGQWLSLEEGVFSNVGGYVGNFSIAYGAVIENAVGGTGDDSIMGNEAGNLIDGGAGADSISGGEGDDLILGGTQFDTLDGGGGNDSIDGGMGNDKIYGGGASDRLSGGNGNDTIEGGLGNDLLVGGRGEDFLDGGNRQDRLVGGSEDDTLFGGNGNDVLRGGTDNDYLDGGAGNDGLIGGAGFDTLIGGEGNDTLIGAFNADQFIFEDGHGIDVIEDFEANNAPEKIVFSNLSTLNSLFDVIGTGSGTAAATQVGSDVMIDTGGGNSILLKNVLYSELDATDFIF